MRTWTHALALALTVPCLQACSDETVPVRDAAHADDSSDADAELEADAGTSGTLTLDAVRAEASVEADADDASVKTYGDGGIECCPPSAKPGCCMEYGGANVHGCNATCDGMPNPADPAWRLLPDPYGCPRWSSKGATLSCCGAAPVPDGGQRFSCYGDHGEPPQAIEGGT